MKNFILVALLMAVSLPIAAEYDAVECSGGKTPVQLDDGSWVCRESEEDEGPIVYPKGDSKASLFE